MKEAEENAALDVNQSFRGIDVLAEGIVLPDFLAPNPTTLPVVVKIGNIALTPEVVIVRPILPRSDQSRLQKIVPLQALLFRPVDKSVP